MSKTTSVTRIATFKFKPDVTPSQIGDRTRTFLALYAQNSDLILHQPRGGRPLETKLDFEGTGIKRETQWDTGFVVVFKSEEARVQFDKVEGHQKVKVCWC
jgi:hypothetical protein